MLPTPNTVNVRYFSSQKLFGGLGNRLKDLESVFSGIKVRINKGKRRKPKKNSGKDHGFQFLASKLCGHKSVYRLTGSKTPKVLRKKGILFPEKSTHYDNVENIELESVIKTNSVFLKKFFVFREQVDTFLDLTTSLLEGNYEGKKNGYTGRNMKGEPVTGECHQTASVSLLGFKQNLFDLRLPGNYTGLSNPALLGDTKLCGLNFDQKVCYYLVEKSHKLLPGITFFWHFDRGFNEFEFWFYLKEIGDDFITPLDSNAECVKQEQRLIDLGSIVLQKSIDFDYHETILKLPNTLEVKAVYIKPRNEKIHSYWLITTKTKMKGVEVKKEYNKRSGDEPLYDYLKNDYNLKKPCKKSFQGAQVYTALICLIQNIISWLSQTIFGCYFRLQTLTSSLLEFFLLEKIFDPKNENESIPPDKPDSREAGKNTKKS